MVSEKKGGYTMKDIKETIDQMIGRKISDVGVIKNSSGDITRVLIYLDGGCVISIREGDGRLASAVSQNTATLNIVCVDLPKSDEA